MFSFDKFICVESSCLQEHYIFYQNTRSELTMLYSTHYDSIVLWNIYYLHEGHLYPTRIQ